jgi:hypothetical protein
VAGKRYGLKAVLCPVLVVSQPDHPLEIEGEGAGLGESAKLREKYGLRARGVLDRFP